MSSLIPIRGVIFDLGDVLFTWSSNTTTTVSVRTLRKILRSPTWIEYECGRICQGECYDEIAQEFSIDHSQVAAAFAQARESLRPNESLVSFLGDLRSKDSLNVYAMSNIAKEDLTGLGEKMDWSLFDRVFTSGETGMRKPDLGFYEHVLKEIKLAPEQVVFVDDKQENVLAANELGIRGIVFDTSTMDTLHTLLYGSIAKGHEYLYRNAKNLNSITDSAVSFPDNFAQLLILEATQDQKLVNLRGNPLRTWNFFAGEAALIPGGYFPDDLDTTSLALHVFQPKPSKELASILDKMAEYVTSNGLFMTYFDRDRPRCDPVVSANVLACFYHFRRGHQFSRTLEYIHDVLSRRAYINGTRYYPSPDSCLWFFSRLLQASKHDAHLQTKMGPLLESRVQERVGKGGSALDLAMRILACDSVGIQCAVDRHALLLQQSTDGGWEAGGMYQYGSTGVKIGNRGVTTALAVKALASASAPNAGVVVNQDA